VADYRTQFSVAIAPLTHTQIEWACKVHNAASMADEVFEICNMQGRRSKDGRPPKEFLTDGEWLGFPEDVRDAALKVVGRDGENGSSFALNSDDGEDGSLDAGTLYVFSEDGGGLEAAAQLVQSLLVRFDIAEPVILEWADTCSRPRPDAFGGGAMVITRDRILSMSTRQMAERMLNEVSPPVTDPGVPSTAAPEM